MAESRNNSTAYVPTTIEERRMLRSLDHAFDMERVASDGDAFRYVGTRAVQELFDAIVRMGDKGCVLGATLFSACVREREIPRAALAHMLTHFALALRDHDAYLDRSAVRESEVAHAGRFLTAFIREHPCIVLEWAEDAESGDAANGFDRQPTAIIRGVLLSPSFDHREAVNFWRMSAASKRFPDRIFSDPCGYDDGTIFSSWHTRAFSLVFAHAPQETVVRFVAHMREHAVRKSAKMFDEVHRTWYDELVPANERERLNVFRSIAGGIENRARRDFVARLYGVD